MSEKATNRVNMTKKYTLTPKLLYTAYSQGYFPMPDEQTGDIFWYRPDPRAIIPLDGFHVSRSLRRTIKRQIFKITYNQAFLEVMEGCSERAVTWINEEIKYAYLQLFKIGAAKSIEVWFEDQLVGGVYGVSFGGAFFAESMFHRATDASKVALYYLVQKLKERKFELLECQFLTEHLKSLGAVEIPDYEYAQRLERAIQKDVYF